MKPAVTEGDRVLCTFTMESPEIVKILTVDNETRRILVLSDRGFTSLVAIDDVYVPGQAVEGPLLNCRERESLIALANAVDHGRLATVGKTEGQANDSLERQISETVDFLDRVVVELFKKYT
ncbi:MAG: hypothetical protein AAF086_08280 [Planctomycetota bacterium]